MSTYDWDANFTAGIVCLLFITGRGLCRREQAGETCVIDRYLIIKQLS